MTRGGGAAACVNLFIISEVSEVSVVTLVSLVSVVSVVVVRVVSALSEHCVVSVECG